MTASKAIAPTMVRRDLSNSVGNDSINHYSCDYQPGYEKVWTGTHKHCQNINGCRSSSLCILVGACKDALQSYRCFCVAGFESVVLKNHPNNLTCTPQVCGEPPFTENPQCSHQLNSTLHSRAAATASNASSTSVLSGETVTCTSDAGFALNQSDSSVEGFDVDCVIDGPRSSFVGASVCQPPSCGKLPVVQNSKTVS